MYKHMYINVCMYLAMRIVKQASLRGGTTWWYSFIKHHSSLSHAYWRTLLGNVLNANRAELLPNLVKQSTNTNFGVMSTIFSVTLPYSAGSHAIIFFQFRSAFAVCNSM